MDFGVTGKLGGYNLAEQYRKRMQRQERVDNFLATNFTPGLNEGFLMTFDENREINHACVVGEGRFTVSS